MSIMSDMRSWIAAKGDTTEANLVVGTFDQLQSAINSAVRRVQMDIDFEHSVAFVSAPVPLASGYGFDEFTNPIKKVLGVYRDSAARQPVDFIDRHDNAILNRAEDWRHGRPDTAYTSNSSNGFQVFQRGRTLWLRGTGTSTDDPITLYFDVLELNSYVSGSTDDWFLDACQEYIRWQALTEINYNVKEFVYRQEGNLMPPDKKAQEELEAVRLWNASLTSGTDYI